MTLYRPGDLVEAKFATFPFWPAVVMADYHVKSNVVEECKEWREPGQDNYYVIFMGDNNFGSVTPKRLHAYSREKAVKDMKLKNLKPLKKKACKAASEYTNYWDLLVENGLVQPTEQRYELETIKALPPGVGKKRRTPADTDEGSTNINSKKVKNEKSIRESKGKKPKEESVEKRTKTEDEVDKSSEEYRKSEAYMIRFTLQKGLIQRESEPAYDDLLACHKTFQRLEEIAGTMDIAVLRYSKLYKVMGAILRLKSLERPEDFKFIERAERLIVLWEPLIIKLKGEKEQRERDTPNTSAADISLLKAEQDETASDGVSQKSNGEILKSTPGTSTNSTDPLFPTTDIPATPDVAGSVHLPPTPDAFRSPDIGTKSKHKELQPEAKSAEQNGLKSGIQLDGKPEGKAVNPETKAGSET